MALDKRDQRALMIGGGIIVVAGLAWFFLLRGGGGSTSAGGTVSPPPSGVPVISGTPFPSTSPVTTPPPPPNGGFVIGGKDPFSPMALPSASASPSTSPKQSDHITINNDTVTLHSILDSQTPIKIDVSVNNKTYKVVSGGSFAKHYTVTAIAGTCADFKYVNPNASSTQVQHKAFELCVAS